MSTRIYLDAVLRSGRVLFPQRTYFYWWSWTLDPRPSQCWPLITHESRLPILLKFRKCFAWNLSPSSVWLNHGINLCLGYISHGNMPKPREKVSGKRGCRKYEKSERGRSRDFTATKPKLNIDVILTSLILSRQWDQNSRSSGHLRYPQIPYGVFSLGLFSWKRRLLFLVVFIKEFRMEPVEQKLYHGWTMGPSN